MKKTALIAIAALALASCASLENAGHSAYQVKANAAAGYDLSVADGKEYANGRAIAFDAKSGTLMIEEGPSKAFQGQGIAAKAATVLPVTGLQDLVRP